MKLGMKFAIKFAMRLVMTRIKAGFLLIFSGRFAGYGYGIRRAAQGHGDCGRRA